MNNPVVCRSRNRKRWAGAGFGCIVTSILLATAACPPPALAADGGVPSTFSTTVGSALLCMDHVDPFYFWSYLNKFFGPPYKNEGGAYWFKVKASLWGVPVSDVLVSDGKDQLVFLAAAMEAKPDALSEAILGNAGVAYSNERIAQYSPKSSGKGGKIIYFGQNSKIYCANYNLDYNR
jgi:hypothetical protein